MKNNKRNRVAWLEKISVGEFETDDEESIRIRTIDREFEREEKLLKN